MNFRTNYTKSILSCPTYHMINNFTLDCLKKKYYEEMDKINLKINLDNLHELSKLNLKIKFTNLYIYKINYLIKDIFSGLNINPSKKFNYLNIPNINKYKIVLNSYLKYLKIDFGNFTKTSAYLSEYKNIKNISDYDEKVLVYFLILELLLNIKIHNNTLITSLIKIKNNWNLYLNINTLSTRDYKINEDSLIIKANYKNSVWIQDLMEEDDKITKKIKKFKKANELILKKRTLIKRINNNNDKCSICLDHLAPTNKTVFVKKHYCGNIFHLKCILKWEKIQKTCPLCRASLKKWTIQETEEGETEEGENEDEETEEEETEEGSEGETEEEETKEEETEEEETEEGETEEGETEEEETEGETEEEETEIDNEVQNLFSEVDTIEDIGNITVNKIKETLQISIEEAKSIFKDTLINLIQEISNISNNSDDNNTMIHVVNI